MTEESPPTLQLTYEQFLAVLSRWDSYMYVEFSEMSRGLPAETAMGEMLSGIHRTPGRASAVHARLSDLAGIMWRTLEAGASEVDRIHDEVFFESQVEHFRKTYASPEHVAAQLRDEYGYWHELDPPTEMFWKLGKAARMVIAREGWLEEAVEAYRRGEEICRDKEQAEKNERAQRREVEKSMAETRRRVRELDGSQCVFCGAVITNNFRYVQLSQGEFEPENVVFACATCHATLRRVTPEEAGFRPAFGRFAAPEAVRA